MINSKRVIDTFCELVSLDSPSFDERLVCEKIKSCLAELGIASTEDNANETTGGTTGNLYAYIDGNGDAPLLFSSHMDTVEPAKNKKAIIHSDGKITSDGTTVLGSDDLAGVSAIIEALRVIKENNIPHRPLELLFTVSEEQHCDGASAFDYKKLKSKEAYVFDMDGEVGKAANKAPSILKYTAKFFGKAAHAGFDAENGIHAIKAASLAVCNLPCGNIEKGVTANVGIISGGKATNIVPEYAEITGEIRSFDEGKVSERLDEVIRICKEAGEKIGARVQVDHELQVKAFSTDENGAVIKRFKKVAASLGLSGEMFASFGGSDLNVMADKGIEGIVVATGMNDCHSVNEYTYISEIEKASELALKLMTSED